MTKPPTKIRPVSPCHHQSESCEILSRRARLRPSSCAQAPCVKNAAPAAQVEVLRDSFEAGPSSCTQASCIRSCPGVTSAGSRGPLPPTVPHAPTPPLETLARNGGKTEKLEVLLQSPAALAAIRPDPTAPAVMIRICRKNASRSLGQENYAREHMSMRRRHMSIVE